MNEHEENMPMAREAVSRAKGPTIHGYTRDQLYEAAAFECRRVGLQPEDTQDCVQDFLIHVLTSKAFQHAKPQSAEQWLRVCAKNHVRTYLLRRSRELRREIHVDLTQAELRLAIDECGLRDQPNPIDLAADRQMAGKLRSSIAALPPEQQKAVALAYLVGLTPTEVATSTGRTPDAVRHTLARARKRLRSLLEESGFSAADAENYLLRS